MNLAAKQDSATLQQVIDTAWERRAEIDGATKGEVREAVEAALHMLDNGTARIAEKTHGGWQVNQITTISSGLPFSPSYDGCGADRDTGPCRPNLVGEVSTDGNRDRWFTTTGGQTLGRASANPFTSPGQTTGPWQRPMPGTFGNAPRNSLRGPSYFNTDFSLIKSLNFKENFRGQFRAEVFNFFNNVNLGQPNGCVDCGSAGRGGLQHVVRPPVRVPQPRP